MPKSTQADDVAGQREDVAGVRVRVKEPVVEDLLQDDVGAAGAKQPAVVAGGIEQVDVRDLDPFDVFGGEDAGGAELPVDRRDVDGRVVEKALGDPLDVGGLDAEVDLLLQGAGKLLDDLDRLVQGQLLHVPFRQGGQVEHDLEVHLDRPRGCRAAGS